MTKRSVATIGLKPAEMEGITKVVPAKSFNEVYVPKIGTNFNGSNSMGLDELLICASIYSLIINLS